MMWWMGLAWAASLQVDPIVVKNEQFVVDVTGLTPGAGVVVIAGRRQAVGPCSPWPGDCLDIDGSLNTLVGVVQASSSGRVLRRLRARLPAGDWYLQALTYDGMIQSSQVQPLSVFTRLGDADGDGANNVLEFYARTPLQDADADDDGVLDAVDLWPFTPSAPLLHLPDDRVISDPNDSLPDPEFDTVTHQVVWQTRTGSAVWVADIDPSDGSMHPVDGRGVLVDVNVLDIAAVRNGPEWMQTDQGARVVYAKDRGQGPELVVAYEDGGPWSRDFLGPGLGGIGSLDPNDSMPRIYYADPGVPPLARTRFVGDPASDRAYGLPLWWGRWIAGSHDLIAYRSDPDGTPQVVSVDPTTGTIEQRTFSPTFKRSVFGWQAPEHGVEAFFTTVGPPGSEVSVAMEVYLDDGAGGWALHDTITGPPGFPFIISPEPFVVNGQSYISFLASKEPLNEDNGLSQVWVIDIDPATQWARQVSDGSVLVMKDPEPAVLGAQAFVYYSEAIGTQRILHRCDVGL